MLEEKKWKTKYNGKVEEIVQREMTTADEYECYKVSKKLNAQGELEVDDVENRCRCVVMSIVSAPFDLDVETFMKLPSRIATELRTVYDFLNTPDVGKLIASISMQEKELILEAESESLKESFGSLTTE